MKGSSNDTWKGFTIRRIPRILNDGFREKYESMNQLSLFEDERFASTVLYLWLVDSFRANGKV